MSLFVVISRNFIHQLIRIKLTCTCKQFTTIVLKDKFKDSAERTFSIGRATKYLSRLSIRHSIFKPMRMTYPEKKRRRKSSFYSYRNQTWQFSHFAKVVGYMCGCVHLWLPSSQNIVGFGVFYFTVFIDPVSLCLPIPAITILPQAFCLYFLKFYTLFLVLNGYVTCYYIIIRRHVNIYIFNYTYLA